MPTATACDVALIGRVREADAEARAARTRVFLLAADWADAHAGGDSSPPSGECQQFLCDRVGTTGVTATRRCRRRE